MYTHLHPKLTTVSYLNVFQVRFFMQLYSYIHHWSTKFFKWLCSSVGACLTSSSITFCEKRKGTFKCWNIGRYTRHKHQRQRRRKMYRLVNIFVKYISLNRKYIPYFNKNFIPTFLRVRISTKIHIEFLAGR